MRGNRRFTWRDQLAFAELSGDFNPVHVDAIAARRLIFGRPVVHGVHLLLWALDCWSEQRASDFELVSLDASFSKAVGLDDAVSCRIREEQGTAVVLELSNRGSVAAKIKLEWSREHAAADVAVGTGHPERNECLEFGGQEVEHAAGSLELTLHRGSATQLFPSLSACIPPVQLAEILATTRLVGMHCPGLHSVYSALDLSFRAADGSRPLLTWSVASMDGRYGSVSIAVNSASTAGMLEAFLRPPPTKQPAFAELQRKVGAGEFADQRALVVGGSRGLGELTAKLLAAGGADVRVTYRLGHKDALRVADEIRTGGGSAECLALDVRQPAESMTSLMDQGWSPSHLYYFATPSIFRARKNVFSAELFHEFCDYFVTGFSGIVSELLDHGLTHIFYPSSVALDDLPTNMAEYSSAKRAGEVLCDFFRRSRPDLALNNPRLPRLPTDQTASFLPVASADPTVLMLEHLRRLAKE